MEKGRGGTWPHTGWPDGGVLVHVVGPAHGASQVSIEPVQNVGFWNLERDHHF